MPYNKDFMSMPKNVFKRKKYASLLKWKSENGTSAIMIEGARRVGKSVLAEEFAKKEYKSYILIDFSKASEEVRNLFEDISDLEYLFTRLQFLFGVKLFERQSVIVFDEVQFQPLARQAIKHLVADGRYDYIETGSLISIKRNVKDILIPSEEHKLYLYPMDYEEFRWALGDTTTHLLLREAFAANKPLSDVVNRKLLRDFRLYMLIGGMPQAVAKYLETNNLADVDVIKRQILDLYDDDFRKIDPSGRIASLYKSIPSQLSRNISRYQTTPVAGKGLSDSKKDELISELEATMTVNVCRHSMDPNDGVGWSLEKECFKMYVADTGLFVTLIFRDRDFAENILYSKLLSDKLEANLGYLYENVVAQMLTAAGRKLFYYTFPTPSEKHYYEIDFLLSEGVKLNPIEIKSSSYKAHSSLDAFCDKFKRHIKTPYILYTKDLHKEGPVHYLPMYMAQFL